VLQGVYCAIQSEHARGVLGVRSGLSGRDSLQGAERRHHSRHSHLPHARQAGARYHDAAGQTVRVAGTRLLVPHGLLGHLANYYPSVTSRYRKMMRDTRKRYDELASRNELLKMRRVLSPTTTSGAEKLSKRA